MIQPPYREKLKTVMLSIAARILDAEGLEGLQARRVAREAGCSVGTLYNVFGSLDELVILANARTLDDLGRALIVARDASAQAPLESRLEALALAYLRFAIVHEKSWRAVFEHHMTAGQTVPEWYREAQARQFSLVEEVVCDVLPEHKTRSRAARALFSAVHGIVALALDRKLGEFDPAETEAQMRLILAAAAQGLTAAREYQSASPVSTA
ncbi:MAG TPA: WHG domain-containing protein [Hyphomicrobiaceae bacterium]|nr:WHG domain-containing protein [Hyphomicrobiaceae bacterium]